MEDHRAESPVLVPRVKGEEQWYFVGTKTHLKKKKKEAKRISQLTNFIPENPAGLPGNYGLRRKSKTYADDYSVKRSLHLMAVIERQQLSLNEAEVRDGSLTGGVLHHSDFVEVPSEGGPSQDDTLNAPEPTTSNPNVDHNPTIVRTKRNKRKKKRLDSAEDIFSPGEIIRFSDAYNKPISPEDGISEKMYEKEFVLGPLGTFSSEPNPNPITYSQIPIVDNLVRYFTMPQRVFEELNMNLPPQKEMADEIEAWKMRLNVLQTEWCNRTLCQCMAQEFCFWDEQLESQALLSAAALTLHNDPPTMEPTVNSTLNVYAEPFKPSGLSLWDIAFYRQHEACQFPNVRRCLFPDICVTLDDTQSQHLQPQQWPPLQIEDLMTACKVSL